MKKQKLIIRIIAIVVVVLLAAGLLWPVISSTVYGDTMSGELLSSASGGGSAVLAENDIAFTDVASLSTASGDGYGELMADAYLYAARECGAVGTDSNAMSVISVGMISGTLPAGKLTDADAKAAVAKGSDGSDVPLVLFYVSAKELKRLAELDASVGTQDSAAQLFFSGINYTYNPNRMLFDRVNDVVFIRGGKDYWPDNTLNYPVVTDLTTANMLLTAEGESNKMISFTPLDENGSEIADFSSCTITDGSGADLPAWRAVASYLASFGGSVPESYAATDGRKIVNDSSDIGAIVASPGKATWLAIGLTVAICALLGLIAVKFIVGNLKKIDDGGPEDRLG